MTGASARFTIPLPPYVLGMLGLIFAALFIILVLLLSMVRPDNRLDQMSERIGHYGPRHVEAGAEGGITRIAGRLITPLLRFHDVEAKLAERLDVAGVKWRPAEWVLMGACGAAGLALLLTVMFGSPVIGVVIGAGVAWVAMRFGLSFVIGRRRSAFAGQLPDVLQFVSGSLRSGFSLPQALTAAVQEDTQPSAAEFARALAESRIGVDLEDALDTIADRMDSRDLRWTVIAIRIQREVGGNLAEVLGNTVDTMRERAGLRRHVRALSAEGRMSAYILVSLPIAIGGWLFLTRPQYVSVLYTSTIGIVMLVIAVLLIVGGALWMRSLIKVEV